MFLSSLFFKKTFPVDFQNCKPFRYGLSRNNGKYSPLYLSTYFISRSAFDTLPMTKNRSHALSATLFLYNLRKWGKNGMNNNFGLALNCSLAHNYSFPFKYFFAVKQQKARSFCEVLMHKLLNIHWRLGIGTNI